MSQFYGMDPEVVGRVGLQLQHAGNHLQEITHRIEQLLQRVPGVWDGRDAADFQSWWQQQHRPALQAAAESVRGLGTSAVNNAREQVAVAGAAGHGGGGVGVIGGPGSGNDWVGYTRQGWDAASPFHVGQGVAKDVYELRHGPDSAFQTPGFKQVSTGITVVGVVMDGADVVDGFANNDNGKITTGALGVGLAGLGTFPPAVPVAAAGAATLEVGSWVIPVNNDEYAGSYDAALARHFGPSYDPSNPTSEQAEYGMQRYSGAGGFFNSIGDGVRYKVGGWFD